MWYSAALQGLVPLPSELSNAVSVEESGDRRSAVLLPALARIDLVPHVQVSEHEIDETLPRALDIVVSPGRTFSISTGIDLGSYLLPLNVAGVS